MTTPIAVVTGRSQNRIWALKLIRQVEEAAALLDEIAGRGGFVALVEHAELTEPRRRVLTQRLQRIQDRARSGIVALGDVRFRQVDP
jgi:hypothetical protein